MVPSVGTRDTEPSDRTFDYTSQVKPGKLHGEEVSG
jgi:hypothetical protein